MQYMKIIFSSSDDGDDLFTAQSMHDMCRFEDHVIQSYLPDLKNSWYYRNKYKGNRTEDWIACRSGSLAWYIQLLLGKQSCYDITADDMEKIRSLLEMCHPLYTQGALTGARNTKQPISSIPNQYGFSEKDCYKNDVVHYIFEYALDDRFIQENEDGKMESKKLKLSLMITHYVQGMDLINYFENVFTKHLQKGSVKVVGFFRTIGRKLVVFSNYLQGDLWLFGMAITSVLLIMAAYLQSVILVLATIVNIGFSYIIAYFVYRVVLGIEYFPFINLLSGIVIIAVAADDVFIFYDMWIHFQKEQMSDDTALVMSSGQRKLKSKLSMYKVVQHTFKHATASILVTSLTTAAAFLSNCTSKITALKCFGIFAGSVILANFLLMVVWTPAVVVSIEKLIQSSFYNKLCKAMPCKLCGVKDKIYNCCVKCEQNVFGRMIPYLVSTFWPVILIIFTGLAIIGATLIFYWPRLELPVSSYVKLFSWGKGTLFEDYESHLKYHFPFAVRTEEQENLKIRAHFVWGVFPKDNGGVFDANATVHASLIPDDSFNMTSLKAQQWIINFCHTALNQSFIDNAKPVKCMFDYYLDVLEMACSEGSSYQAAILPCCQIKSFPTEPWRLELCLPVLDGLAQIVANKDQKMSTAISGQPLFSKETNKPTGFWMYIYTTLRASASHSQMNGVYKTINSFSENMLSTTPKGLENGFWGAYPDLLLYDLQNAIENGVFYSISVSLVITMAMMFLTSLNVLITLYAIITIVLVIITTVSSLVLCGWVLNVLESFTLSLAVGLSIDFTIHYGVAYKLSGKPNSRLRAKDSLSQVGTAVAMAALTTFAAGLAVMPSRIVAFQELGTFLMVVMTFSWLYSTFFFQSLLSVLGPRARFCQISFSVATDVFTCIKGWFRSRSKRTQRYRPEADRIAIDVSEVNNPYNYISPLDDELLEDNLNYFTYEDDDVPLIY